MRTARTTLSIAALLVANACTNGATGPDSTSDAEIAEGLTLVQDSPEYVVGTYRDSAAGATIAFEAARVDDQVFLDLRGNDGRHLVTLETLGDSYVMTYLDGALVMTVTRDQLERNAIAEGPEEQMAGIDMVGDVGALDALLNAPEMAVLPHMSRALGARGVTGNAYPASLTIHKMARQTADGLGIDVEPLELGSGEVAECSRPTANNCYGMCGPGCTCWSWVCGNCCYHYGCAKHDSWCRAGKWYYCYNITAVIALFGC